MIFGETNYLRAKISDSEAKLCYDSALNVLSSSKLLGGTSVEVSSRLCETGSVSYRVRYTKNFCLEGETLFYVMYVETDDLVLEGSFLSVSKEYLVYKTL